jgi:UrcA family protein
MITGSSNSSSGYKAGIMAGLMGFMVMAAAHAPAQTLGGDIVVKYADLDINTTPGAETLYERIQRAAAQVCVRVDPIQMQRYRVYLRCQDAAVAHAVGSIASPQLAAIYAARTHRGMRRAA